MQRNIASGRRPKFRDWVSQLLWGVYANTRGDVTEASGELENAIVTRDISSSQTQILAVFLGLPALETLATDPHKKFKVWLAEQLWTLHKDTRGGVLAEGYTNATDERLIAFVKELWMRRNYGGKFGQTVRSLARDPVTFGPGWNSDVFATGGVRRAEAYWTQFLGTLPPWGTEVTRFLDACQYIGTSADPHHGVSFTDPLDGAEIQWNPVRRATKKLPAGEHYIDARLPGVLWKRRRFIPRPWRVDTRANGDLATRIAPCVIHTLDAYFNALVLAYLSEAGIEQVVAIHDSWLLPDFIEAYGSKSEFFEISGEDFLEQAIQYVGQEWLSGIGGFYDWFLSALTGSPNENLASGARDRWRRRVAEQRWPRFTAS